LWVKQTQHRSNICCVEHTKILLATPRVLSSTISNKKLRNKIVSNRCYYIREHLDWTSFRTLRNKRLRPYTDPRCRQSTSPPGVMTCVGFLLWKIFKRSAPNYNSAKLSVSSAFFCNSDPKPQQFQPPQHPRKKAHLS
jgi:hypothetical protein